jgi:hypothetical protein
MPLAPIALFGYNRPEHLKKTFQALKNNTLAAQSNLYIFLDGPKPGAEESTKTVRAAAKQFTGFKSIKIIESSENLGLSKSITSGVTQLIKQYGKTIVLEDDLETSPFFLKYLNDALELYQDEERMACISGYFYPHKDKLPETFLIKGADCWGWATWERAWNLYEEDSKILLRIIRDCNLTKEFNFNGTVDYRQMLQDKIEGKNNSWAINWYASAFIHKTYTLYPNESFVNNIGNDNSGTHCEATDAFTVRIRETPLKLEKLPMQESAEGRRAIELFYSKRPRLVRVFRKIKRFLKKLNTRS